MIVGSTSVASGEAERVQHVIRSSGLDSIVQLTGEVPNAYEYICAADLLVLSSVQEGLPRVILEAMAASKPMVATDVGGCSQAILHGETGLLVPPRNPLALADAIEQVICDLELARQMGDKGRQRVQRHFTMDAMIARHLALYRELLARHQASTQRPSLVVGKWPA